MSHVGRNPSLKGLRSLKSLDSWLLEDDLDELSLPGDGVQSTPPTRDRRPIDRTDCEYKKLSSHWLVVGMAHDD